MPASPLYVLVQNPLFFGPHTFIGLEFPEGLFGKLIRRLEVHDGFRIINRMEMSLYG